MRFFFDPGSAEIKKENEKTLLEIAEMINVLDHYIRIEGHTDNVPMNSDLYRSNWDLSALFYEILIFFYGKLMWNRIY